MMQSRSLSIKDFRLTNQHVAVRLFWIGTFALLTAVGAQVEIPHAPVPFTLQTFFVMLAGGMLGRRDGSLSMILYLLLGAAGLPAFSSAGFGLMRLIGPTGGYLLSFPLAALLIGILLGNASSYWRILTAMGAGLCLIFLLGTAQLWLVTGMSFEEAFGSGFLIFSWWDLLKLAGAAAITEQALRRVSVDS